MTVRFFVIIIFGTKAFDVLLLLSDVAKTTFATLLSQIFGRLFAITEVQRKNFTTNISSKNTQ